MDSIKPPRISKKTVTVRSVQSAPGVSSEPPTEPGLTILAPKKRGWRRFWIITGCLITMLAIGVLGGFLWYKDALMPRSNSSTPVMLTIESGASIDQVAIELEQKSVIKSSLAFTIYAKIYHKTIKAGDYAFAPNQSVSEIAAWLQEGHVNTRKVTILPGKTLKQIRASLIEDGFSSAAVDAALTKTYDHPLLADKPAGATLEGYIFPETYFMAMNASPQELLLRTFDEFERRINAEDLRAKLTARGFDLFQGITLASIVGRETSNLKDQTQVAQVFEARLGRGMRLGSDVTYHYAADLLGVEPAVDIDSPYNTRVYTGLPPGPIANFNLSALQAVAEPAAGDYLYFVAGDDGATHFSHTYEEHQQKILEFCKKLCSQP